MMNTFKQTFIPIIILVLVSLSSYCGWLWFFCRFYVPPHHMAVLTAKTGKPMPEGQILADKGQKGIQKDVLGEGRYFYNPFFYEWKIIPCTIIKPGQVGIVTSKTGAELPDGEFLADKGQKGIMRGVLGPGIYRINPFGFNINIIKALEIPIGYVGVITSLSGSTPPDKSFAESGMKGVMKDILQPGLYYINTAQYKIDICEVGTNQISLVGAKAQPADIRMIRTKGQALQQNLIVVSSQMEEKLASDHLMQQSMRDSFLNKSMAQQDKKRSYQPVQQGAQAPKPQEAQTIADVRFIEFPSKDGFEINLDMTVEFEFKPDKIAFIFMQYGDLYAVVNKIILPQILSVSRLLGSAYSAKEFIVGEGREKFQNQLTQQLKAVLEQKEINVISALIRHVIVPHAILEPIQDVSIAFEKNLTNIEKQETMKTYAKLNKEKSLIDQRRAQIKQETEKLKAEIEAQEKKEVAQIKADTNKQVAKIDKKTALIQAQRIKTLGNAQAKSTEIVESAKGDKHRFAVEAFGSPEAFSLYTFSTSLDPELKVAIVHSGEGTLWTDLDKIKQGDMANLKILKGQ